LHDDFLSRSKAESQEPGRSLKKGRPEVKTEKIKQKNAIFRLLLTFLF